MKTSTTIIIVAIGVILSTVINGCYTQIMTPQEVVQTNREKKESHEDISSTLNYNNNCFSCHSKAELDDRYIDWKYYGITTAHNGVIVDPDTWNNQYVGTIDEPVYFPTGPVSSPPGWWVPPAVLVNSPVPVEEKSANRPRTDGATRDDKSDRHRPSTVPASGSNQPSTNTPTNSTQTPPPTTTTTPVQTPAPATNTTSSSDRGRSDTNSTTNSNRTRDNGSTRDGGGRSR